MIRQSSMDHTTFVQNVSHQAVELVEPRPAQHLQRDTSPPPSSVTLDSSATRARQIRHHDEFDLPLYQASLAADVSAIQKLCPHVSPRRARVMVVTARAFARITTGWDDGSFYTVVFDPALGVWRRVLMFGGPVLVPRCAVCGRLAVYRLRDTSYCRMHGPQHLDRSAGSFISDPAADDGRRFASAAALDMPHNH